MSKQLNRHCPVCQSSRGDVLHRQTFLLEKSNPLPTAYDVVACMQCGFVFADTDARQNVYDHYYSAFSKYEDVEIGSGSGSLEYDGKRLDETARSIASFIKEKTSAILDIGSGNGGLLKKLRELGYAKLSALDPSSICVENMKSEKIDAYRGSLFDDLHQHFGQQKFDLIILSHVLEHVYDLRTALDNISILMNEGCAIYVEVPDAARYHEFFIAPYYYFDVEHINHFTDRSMESLMMLFGFQKQISSVKDLPISETIRYPAIFSFYVYRKNMDAEAVKMFLSESAKEQKLEQLFEPLIENKTKIAVWGAGNFTKRLLASSRFDLLNIAFFVDKDVKKQGTSLNGVEIKAPEALKAFPGPIMIVAALYAEDILKEVRAKYPENEIIVLR